MTRDLHVNPRGKLIGKLVLALLCFKQKKRLANPIQVIPLIHWSLFLVLLLTPFTASSQEHAIASLQAGECTLTLEANDAWNTLRLRARHPDYKACSIDEKSVVLVLNRAFSGTGLGNRGGGYTSLSLGRLVDYPWLSRFLASAAHDDPDWNAKTGKHRHQDINAYVSRLLAQKGVPAGIETALAQGGYALAGVTVEKVLVGAGSSLTFPGDKPSGKLPFDAQTWLRLRRTDRDR